MLIRVDPNNPNPKLIKAISNMIRIGQLAVFQTDTIYGIGTSATSQAGVTRLFSAKKREQNKPLGIFVSDISQVQKYCEVRPQFMQFLSNIWPGNITCVFHLKSNTNLWLTPQKDQPSTVAVRIPKSKIISSLLSQLGVPLLQSSVNISGQEHLTHEKLREVYYRFADVMIDSGAELSAKPSTVITLAGKEVQLLREGSTPWNEIKMFLDIARVS